MSSFARGPLWPAYPPPLSSCLQQILAVEVASSVVSSPLQSLPPDSTW
jgi:hypothetical protein